MRLKRHCHSLGSAAARSQNDLPQHVGMRPVNSVKIADAYQRGPEVSGNLVEFMKNLHELHS